MRHSAAAPPVRSVRAASSPFFAVTVLLAALSVSLFGYGVFLHLTTKPTPAIGPAHASSPAHMKGALRAGKGSVKKTPISAKNSSPPSMKIGFAGQRTDLAFEAMLGGGLGLLLTALCGLILSHQLRDNQSQAIRSLLQAEQAAWDKQRKAMDTQREKLSAELQEAQQNKAEIDSLRQHASRQFQEFFRTLPVACFCFAADGKIVRWNAACEALYGISSAEALDSTLWESVVPVEEREAMIDWMQRVLAGESVLDVERRDQTIQGTIFPLRCSMVPLYDADGEIIGGLSAGIDMTELAQFERQTGELRAALQRTHTELQQACAALEAQQAEAASFQKPADETPSQQGAELAVLPRDPITGLYSEAAFRERLHEETERAHRYNTPLSVIVFDLDGFGGYNQTLGFEAGNQALQSVAALIESKIRTVDVAARCEADRYALILPETNEAGTRIAADRLRAGIAGMDGVPQPLTACFGAALLTPDISSAETLLTQALDSLRRAQSYGPNRVVCHGDTPHPAIRKSRQPSGIL